MKKVLFVIMNLEMGGAEKSLVNLLNELSPEDAEVDLLLIKRRGVLMKQIPDWVNIIDTPYELRCLYGGKIDRIQGLSLAIRRMVGTVCARAYRERKRRHCWRWRNFYSDAIPPLEKHYDVAAAYLPEESMYYVAEKVSADRKISWIHTDVIVCGVSGADYGHYFRFFDKIVTISKECVNGICSLCPEVIDKVQCLPNIVSSNLIRTMAEKKTEEQIPADIFSIVSVGRLEYVKGFDMAVKAAAILKEKQVRFCWQIIGDGSERENLEKLIEQNGLKTHVVLLGLKENPYPYIKNSDLVVQTSRFEGKSIALDEAKILGIPVLATNYATVKDQISSDEGWIVGMNPEEIAAGIINVINNPEELQKIKSYLREHEYGNAHVVKDYLECLGV